MNVSLFASRGMRAASWVSLIAAVATAQQQPPPPPPSPQAATPSPASQLTIVHPRRWEHETSDLPVNPRIHFGALASGLRYAWLDNPEPEQRVYLRLHVNAGSLGETASERGIAHFLEHMAFNGSKHFAPGTLVEWLQQHGLGFGGDTNAFTSFGQTIYMLDLPTADEAMVADGLRVLRDVTDGLLLLDEEIGSEKGVIDGEERESDSAEFRAMCKTLETVFAGTLIPQRMPIGTKAARDTFESKAMRAFYERWYRPENCTLLVVGDLDGRDPTHQIAAAFGDLVAPAAPLATEPPLGVPTLEKKAFVVFDAEIPTVTLQVQLLRPYVEEPDNRATRLRDLALDHARQMVNLRFSELTQKPETPFNGAQLASGGGLDLLDGEELTVDCAPEKWPAALTAVQTELRRALQHGFEQAELDEIRAGELRGLDEAVESEKTSDSDGFVDELLAACEERWVPTDAATDAALLKPAITALTVEQCHQALAKAWSKGTLVLSAVGGLDLGPEGEKKLTAAWAASSESDVTANPEESASGWGYASDPSKAGKVAARATDAAFGFEEVTFENGVRLLLKKTDFKEREILLRALVGEGTLSLDVKESPLRLFTQMTFGGGALGKHSADELRRLAAGKAVGVQFQILEDAFAFSGGTTKEDLAFECELTCAYLTDPGFREDGTTAFRRMLPQIYESQKHQPNGPIALQFLPKLYGNDVRVCFPPIEVEQAFTTSAVAGWLKPAFEGAPITFVVVGDLDVEATITAVARTFGLLPPRRARIAHDDRRRFPAMTPGLHESYSIATQVPNAMVVVQFATTDGRDAATRRNLDFLVDVVNDRLRVEIREKLGASYSPQAGGNTSLVFPGNGNLAMQAMTEPAAADQLAEACLAVADQLAKEGVTDEEVARLRPEVLAHLRDRQRTNGYWLDALEDFHGSRDVRSDLATLLPHYETLTAAALTELAKKYLKKELASVAIVRPAAPGSPPGASGAK